MPTQISHTLMSPSEILALGTHAVAPTPAVQPKRGILARLFK